MVTQLFSELRSYLSDNDIDLSAQDAIDMCIGLLDDVCIKDDAEFDKFDAWLDKCKESWCELSGTHKWIHDHCGYWGHQYCDRCRCQKYPELTGKCGFLEITEEQYSEANRNSHPR